ncbi:MAG: hypothetical protein EBY17_13310 [Acidobacteriia bacterium]|nr:hypothetical protein [Terriglobia bacterium]
MKPDFTGVWKLIRGESEFGFLPPPRLRVDTISHLEPEFWVRTRQKDANGDLTVDRDLVLGGAPIEVTIRGRVRLVRAFWDDSVLVVETVSEVSGKPRRLVDRRTLDADNGWMTIERLQEQPGGPVRQKLRLRRSGYSHDAMVSG